MLSGARKKNISKRKSFVLSAKRISRSTETDAPSADSSFLRAVSGVFTFHLALVYHLVCFATVLRHPTVIHVFFNTLFKVSKPKYGQICSISTAAQPYNWLAFQHIRVCFTTVSAPQTSLSPRCLLEGRPLSCLGYRAAIFSLTSRLFAGIWRSQRCSIRLSSKHLGLSMTQGNRREPAIVRGKLKRKPSTASLKWYKNTKGT